MEHITSLVKILEDKDNKIKMLEERIHHYESLLNNTNERNTITNTITDTNIYDKYYRWCNDVCLEYIIYLIDRKNEIITIFGPDKYNCIIYKDGKSIMSTVKRKYIDIIPVSQQKYVNKYEFIKDHMESKRFTLINEDNEKIIEDDLFEHFHIKKKSNYIVNYIVKTANYSV
jgi:hypothetical protein